MFGFIEDQDLVLSESVLYQGLVLVSLPSVIFFDKCAHISQMQLLSAKLSPSFGNLFLSVPSDEDSVIRRGLLRRQSPSLLLG